MFLYVFGSVACVYTKSIFRVCVCTRHTNTKNFVLCITKTTKLTVFLVYCFLFINQHDGVAGAQHRYDCVVSRLITACASITTGLLKHSISRANGLLNADIEVSRSNRHF